MATSGASSPGSAPSEPEFARRFAGKHYKHASAFYNEDISSKLTHQVAHFAVQAREILEKYSGIPPDQVIPHIHAVREKAWAIRAYPCIGSGIYLDPVLCKHPAYPAVLARLKTDSEARFLEVGSFMGSDIRSLVADGVSPNSLIASDVVNFFDVGYEMFRDKNKFRCLFIESDIMKTDGPLSELNNSIDAIHISKVMHQWSFDQQVEACVRLVELSRPGCIILGDQMGGATGHELYPYPDLPAHWMHDSASWFDLWKRVQEETTTKWEVNTHVKTIEEMGWDRRDYQYLRHDANIIFFWMNRLE